MPKASLTYTPNGRDGFECVLRTENESKFELVGSLVSEDHSETGDIHLLHNPALINEVWAFGIHEASYRRLRADEKRRSHRAEADRACRDALALARLAQSIRSERREGWCSACFLNTTHCETWTASVQSTYLCNACGSPTIPCAAPRCRNLAAAKPTAASRPRYCAEHRHDIPSFESLEEKFGSIEDYLSWLTYKKKNLAKRTRTAAVVAVGGAVVAPAAFVAAPLIGGATGVLSGLSGAAATSHGLAVWGGGAIAAGGYGMAGGTVVLTALGAGIGGALGGVTATAYLRADPSFGIVKLQDGSGPAVLVCNGFLTEGHDGWGGWREVVGARFPHNPIYRVHWGSKELKAFGTLATGAGTKQVGLQLLKRLASSAMRKAPGAGPLAALLTAADLAKNPWHVAAVRADMTGALLAELIARTSEQEFILVGHSLGGRVMVGAAKALGSRSRNRQQIREMHLLGAAIGQQPDWRPVSEAVRGPVHNYHSRKDSVLSIVYRTAQGGQRAVGEAGIKSKFANIKNHDLTRSVLGHSAYFDQRMKLS